MNRNGNKYKQWNKCEEKNCMETELTLVLRKCEVATLSFLQEIAFSHQRHQQVI